MILLKNVSKTFGKIKALDNVTLKIEKGEFVFLTGPSGAGKTTIVRLILGELTPERGKIIFQGHNVASLKKKEIPQLRQKIGVVFQDFKLLSERTVRENVEVALAVIGVSPKEWKERVNHVLKLVGLTKKAELFPAQLSGGELQRVSLARALVVNPKLILADEPTGNLDWETAGKLMELFEKINGEGKTVVVATHHQGIIDKLKKRVIILRSGKVFADKKVNQGGSKEKSGKIINKKYKVEVEGVG